MISTPKFVTVAPAHGYAYENEAQFRARVLDYAKNVSTQLQQLVDSVRYDADYILPDDLGQEVINKTGSDIAANKLVAIASLDTTAGKPKIVLADADVAGHEDLWVTSAAIANNAEGTVYKSFLSPATLDTSGATAAGDPVYLSATAGGFVHTAPTTAISRVHPVGMVVVKHASTGQILWNIGPVRIIGTNEIQAKTVTVAKSNVFFSTEQTGTGSSQNIAHGLGVAPGGVIVWPSDLNVAVVGVYTVTEGSHDATNVVVTVTSGKKFKVFAWA